VLAKKKDKTYKLCIDYRILNTKVLKDRFPVPLIDEVLDKMQNAKYFSVFDLKNEFFHVEIDEASQRGSIRIQQSTIRVLQFSRSFCKVCHLYLSTADKCRYYGNVHR